VRPPTAGKVAEPLATAVLLGTEFHWQDNALLLDGIAAGLREGGRLALLHLGAGGASLLRVASKENPDLDTLSIQLPNTPSARAIQVAVTLAAVQAVKVHGLRNVLAALNPERLRHLIAFGSITAENPHPNMGGYALANELLWRTTLQAARSLPGCGTVAAEWSLWSGAGMAHQSGAVPQARRMGLPPISLRSGMVALVRLMSWPVGPAHAARLLLR
jgi:hypothetical protein